MMLGQTAVSAAAGYSHIGILILIAITLAAAIIIISAIIGHHRRGEVKSSTYESGMPVIGDARRRFNVKFYIVAMLFLLFDVEVVFLWPWAPLFHKAAVSPEHPAVAGLIAQGIGKEFLLIEVVVFLGILFIGYVYAWRRGVFRWS